MKQFLLPLVESLEILIIILISIYLVYGFVAQPFLVQGASMEPNFENGDYLLVDEMTYRFRSPERGEVIVFKNPSNESEFYIKRIIGLPGEKIIIKDGSVFANGNIIDEKYLNPNLKIKRNYVFQLGDNEYFVMGDNRPVSFDSRSWGPLNGDLIVGTARVRFWPPSTMGILEQPYF